MLNDEELKCALDECNRKKVVPLIMTIAGIIFTFISVVEFQIAGAIVSFAVIVIGGILLSRVSKKKEKLISENVTIKVLSDVFNITEYDRDAHINEKVIRNTGLITSPWNVISGSDYFRGSYRGVDITCSDVTLIEETTHTTDESTYTTTTVVFKGQWIILKLRRAVNSRLIVKEKSEKLFGKGYQKVKSDFEVEDMAFNEQFQIKSKDGHEVFLILTPHFMEHIRLSDQKANGRTGFCFMNDEAHFICYNDKDLFEIHGNMKDIGLLRENMVRETKYITDMIDELLENDYLFGTDF